MIIRKGPMPDGWTALPNIMLADGRLSLKARGLLGYLLSRPEGWETDSERLSRSSHAERDGRDAIRSALKELVALGYMTRVRSQDARGLWSTAVFVYPEPQNPENPPVDNPVSNPVQNSVDNWQPTTGYPTPDNPALLTTLEEQEDGEKKDVGTEGPVDNSGSALGRPSGLDKAALASSPSAAGAGAPGVGYADEAASLALTDLERTALDTAQAIEPGIGMFALRAHLWRVGLDSATMVDALSLVQWHMRAPSYSKHGWRHVSTEVLFRIGVINGWEPPSGWPQTSTGSAGTPPPAASRDRRLAEF